MINKKITNKAETHLERLNHTELKPLNEVVRIIDRINKNLEDEQDDSTMYILHFIYSYISTIKFTLIILMGGLVMYCILLRRQGPRNITNLSIAAIPMRETSL